MAIGINDLDDDDEVIVGHQEEQEEQEEQLNYYQNSNDLDDDSFIQDFLKTKGIEDYSKIMFEGDNGIEERSWDSLSKEEKFNILNTPTDLYNIDLSSDLSDDEINLINLIRQSNMSPEDYINLFKENNLDNTPLYKIDDLSDDEVFLLDLESRVGELSDEDAINALNNAKLNEDFYKKLVEGIRKEYKEREEFKNQLELATLEEEQRQAFQEYQSKVISAIDLFNSIGNLDLNLEDKDKEELAQFMLSLDEKGINYLYQALQEPETLTKVAWFILNGEEAFNNVSDYFTNLIKLISENQYKKGLEDGKKGIQSKPTVVISLKNKLNRHTTYNSIDDLDDD